MKKIIGTFTGLVLFTLMACNNNKPGEVKRETIIVPVPESSIPEKNTVITLDKNGVKVSTKKVDVRVNPDKKNN